MIKSAQAWKMFQLYGFILFGMKNGRGDKIGIIEFL